MMMIIAIIIMIIVIMITTHYLIGEFYRAKIIYKELLSAEGHRHYPLREPKCLRMTPDLMLPLGK